jgi:hypothetical protein
LQGDFVERLENNGQIVFQFQVTTTDLILLIEAIFLILLPLKTKMMNQKGLFDLYQIEMVATHPDIRLQFQTNQTSTSAGGYPLALAGIRADIRPKNDPQAAK